MTLLTDEQIEVLITEEKYLPDNYRKRLLDDLKPKRGGTHKQGEIRIDSFEGNIFYIIVRQNEKNVFDFSMILVYEFPDSTRRFRLRRYNGRTTPHVNRLEGEQITGFHIHMATLRYQEAGFNEDAYAQATERYGDLHGALVCMIEDCNLVRPDSERQHELL